MENVIELTEAEKLAIDTTPLSLHFMDDLDNLKDEIKSWQRTLEPKNKKHKSKIRATKTTPEIEKSESSEVKDTKNS